MSNLSEAGRRFLLIACYFEASLALVALLLGWLFDINPFAELFFSENALICGVIATLPLLVLFFALISTSLKSSDVFFKKRRK